MFALTCSRTLVPGATRSWPKVTKCVKDFGNPCAETNEAGLLVEGEGAKKDVPCCLKKEKHQQCLKCKTMDCSYETCSPHLNKNYYSFWDSPKADPDFAKKGMQAAGWGN